jgi:protein-tyrosine phosphatase
VARRCGETAALLAQQRIPLELRLSAENLFDAEFLERELEGRGRHIHHSRYVLVETPYQSGVPALPDLLFRLRRKGIVPVFAHPERCVEFEPAGRAEAAVQMGALLQLDLGSLLGRYGRGPRKEAKRLLDAGLYALAATDLHQASDAESWLGEAIQVLEKMAGRQSVTRMLEEVPARILRNEELV